MLAENIKNIRKQKGMTQEELATRLNIVRQTVSKWEKGLSVPDAELLYRLAEVLETNVSTLLGDTYISEPQTPAVAEQLARISEQLTTRSQHYRKGWKIAVAMILTVLIVLAVWGAFGRTTHTYEETLDVQQQEMDGYVCNRQ